MLETLNYPFATAVDGVAQLTYENREFDGSGMNMDENGYGIKLGVRANVVEQVELNGHVRYYDIGDFEDDTLIGVGALYHFNEMFSVGAEFEAGDDVTNWNITGRYNFPGM